MTTLHQEYDTYKTDFKNKQKDEVIKELHLVELELEDLIENRSAYEKGSAQSFINLSFAIMVAITAIFWKIFDILKDKNIIYIVLVYILAVLVFVGYWLIKDKKKIGQVEKSFSEERKKIKELKMKIKILEDLIK